MSEYAEIIEADGLGIDRRCFAVLIYECLMFRLLLRCRCHCGAQFGKPFAAIHISQVGDRIHAVGDIVSGRYARRASYLLRTNPFRA